MTFFATGSLHESDDQLTDSEECVTHIGESFCINGLTYVLCHQDGLGILPRGGPNVPSQHLGASVFNQTEQTVVGCLDPLDSLKVTVNGNFSVRT